MERGLYDASWLKQVSLKVAIFVWRFHHDDIYCIGGCASMESICHLLLRCDIFGNVWNKIYRWLGIYFISPDSASDHLQQLTQMAGLPRFTHSFLKVIWHACVWILWKERNYMIFNDKAQDLEQIVDNVKFVSFFWLKANSLTSAFSYSDWWRHPLICMDVME
ncbi:uncharacterized protein [Medicago truncatula]|uniref:uncharacterized protein n=1 Tax=Medicago truncatula TaxID=3880 RepID=UPI000D2F1F4F|nr:uncharacterized protein LOC112420080 [Medicago truncatula]